MQINEIYDCHRAFVIRSNTLLTDPGLDGLPCPLIDQIRSNLRTKAIDLRPHPLWITKHRPSDATEIPAFLFVSSWMHLYLNITLRISKRQLSKLHLYIYISILRQLLLPLKKSICSNTNEHNICTALYAYKTGNS